MDVPEHASTLDRSLIAAYRAARYRVDHEPPFLLAADVPSEELAELMRAAGCAGAAFITAWNPRGTLLSREQNERRQRGLLDQLREARLRWIEGFGSAADGSWSGEASVLVLDVDRDRACQMGRRHEQNAVLWAAADGTPRLLLLS